MKKATWYYPDPKSPFSKNEAAEMEKCGLQTILSAAADENALHEINAIAGSRFDLHGMFGLGKIYNNAYGAPAPEAKPLHPEAYLALYPQGAKPHRLACWSAVTNPAPLAKWISDFIDTHPYIKGINIDGLRYPNTCFFKDNPCNCDACRNRRQPWLGHDLLTAEDERDPSVGYMEVKSKIEVITRIVRSIAKAIHDTGKKFSIDPRAVFAGRDTEFDPPPTWGYGPAVFEGQDWPTWCREGVLDGIHIMNYTGNPARFKRLAEQHKALLPSSSTDVHEGIGISSSAGKVSPEIFGQEIEIVKSLKLTGITLFSWQAMSEGHREVLARA